MSICYSFYSLSKCFVACFHQGSLKEKTVENLEKYVVKDVSELHIHLIAYDTFSVTLSFLTPVNVSLKMSFALFIFFFIKGEAPSTPESDE